MKVFNEMMDMNVKGMTNVLHSGKEDGGDNSEHVFWMGKVGAMLVALLCTKVGDKRAEQVCGKRHTLLLLWCFCFSLSSTAGCIHDSQSHSS